MEKIRGQLKIANLEENSYLWRGSRWDSGMARRPSFNDYDFVIRMDFLN